MQKSVSLSWPQTRARRELQPGNTVCTPWGRGVGKSWFMRLCWYLLVAEWDGKLRPGASQPGVRIVLLMPTLEQAKKVHAHLMLEELSNQWGWLKPSINRSDWRITFPGGSWIQWVTAERAKNIRGLRADVICVDEADDVEIETFDAICGPWLSETHSLGMVLISGTPTRGRYGLLYKKHRMGLDGVANHASIHATYRDVPEFVNVERIERERPFIEPSLFKREWECDFDAAEGLVYSMFKEDFHVRNPPAQAPFDEFLVGVDHGYEDAGVFLVAGVLGHGRDATTYVLEEVYQTQKTESWWVQKARELNKKYPQAKWYADPSQPARIEALKREAGIRIIAADNAIEDGVSAVADRFLVRRREDGSEYAKLYVSPSCKNYIRELGLYRRKRDPKNKERVLDDIEDKHNHVNDSCRYAIYSRFGKPSTQRIEYDDTTYQYG